MGEWEVRTNMKTESDAPPLTSSIGCHVTHVPQGGSSPKPGDPTYTDAEWWTAPQLFGPVATALDATLVLNSTDPLSSGLDAATQAALVAASTLTEAVPGTAVARRLSANFPSTPSATPPTPTGPPSL